jgi:ABC-type nitrate/sulfonate/bicarbonate transport system substrate-binding protein
LNSSVKSLLVVLQITLVMFLAGCSSKLSSASSSSVESKQPVPLRVAIAPYQDMSILFSEKEPVLEKQYGVKLEFLTMPWEEIIPAVASAGQTVDVGFASIADYMCKSEHLNGRGDDPLLYIYPAYIFHGGAFMTFNPAVPVLDPHTVKDHALVKKFLTFKLGVQKNSCSHMLLWLLAYNAGVKFSSIQVVDTTLNDGMLAVENGSLDAAAAGLTQRTEALKRHGRVAVDMDTVGLVDISGFICKESVYRKRKKDIESLIRIWCDCSRYVLSDIDHHSAASLAYLKANASTKYTLDEFKRALAQEYFPRNVAEEQRDIISSTGKYSIARIATLSNQYLLDIGAIKTAGPIPQMITIK